MTDFAAIRAAVDAAAAADLQQQETFRATLASRDAEIVKLRARVAELEQAQQSRTLWGANVWSFPGETYPQALARTEAAIGPLQIVRYFCPTAPKWPTETGTRPLHLSFKWSPTEVIAGRHDAAFRTWCAAAPARTTWWTYEHEADAKVQRGLYTADSFRAAFRRLAGIAKASGKDLRATLVLTGWTLEWQSGRNWRDFDPGADVVDVYAWDPYHSLPHTDPAKVAAACRRIAVETGKPWAIAETGVDKNTVIDPAVRAKTLTALARDLATVRPLPEFVCYFDAALPAEPYAWDISREPAAAKAWNAGRAG